jgi:hypothetical protein
VAIMKGAQETHLYLDMSFLSTLTGGRLGNSDAFDQRVVWTPVIVVVIVPLHCRKFIRRFGKKSRTDSKYVE